MPRAMNDADYQYRPVSWRTREKMQAAARARLGIPEGCCRIYGVIVPLLWKDACQKVAASARRRGRYAARVAVQAQLAVELAKLISLNQSRMRGTR